MSKNSPAISKACQVLGRHGHFLRSPLCGAEPLVSFVVVVVVVYILGSCAARSASLHPVPLPISFV
jgi:hypothetical protein